MAVYHALKEKELVGIYRATWFIKGRLAEVMKELKGVRVLFVSLFFWGGGGAGGGGQGGNRPIKSVEV